MKGARFWEAEERRRFKISLDPLIYKTFRMLCKRLGYRRPNRVLEAFMLATISNPALLHLTIKLSRGADDIEEALE